MNSSGKTDTKEKVLLLAVFLSGMTTLAVEMTATRLIGTVFGTSNLVWASVIGLILVYLTVGYLIGGKWADRSPYYKTMYRIMAWGGFSAGIIPFVARPILRSAASAFEQLEMGILFGSFVAVLILLVIPVILLGMISPFAIRISIKDHQEAGKVSGRIYGISTIGSFIGTFVPVLISIPLLGTTLTFTIFSVILILIATVGLIKEKDYRFIYFNLVMIIILLVLSIIWIKRPIKTISGQIYETESAYNYIQVIEKDGYRLLKLNEGQGIHSKYHPEQIGFGGPWQQFLISPFFNPAPYSPESINRVAIIGLAGGTTVRQLTAAYGAVQIDGYELDPKIVEVGRHYFMMDQPNLNVFTQDGRWGLENSLNRYTIIGIDAYRPPYIPWHLTTIEFFRSVYDHLDEDGSLVMNVASVPGDDRLLGSLIKTIDQVFPSVYLMSIPDSLNWIIYATRSETSMENLYQNYLYVQADKSIHPLILESLSRFIVYQSKLPDAGTVFTDDRTQAEWITNSMVLNLILSGDTDILE